MRLFVALCMCIVSSTGAYCQQASNSEKVIARMIDSGFFEGHDSKVIGPMGDAAAVVITKVIAAKELRPNDIDTILVILGHSFADPSGVKIDADRQPRTAMFVLRHLDLSTNDPSLKNRIAETRRYIRQQYDKSTQTTPSQ